MAFERRGAKMDEQSQINYQKLCQLCFEYEGPRRRSIINNSNFAVLLFNAGIRTSPTMGVTILHAFPIIENRTGPQTIDFLTKRVVALGAVQAGTFLVDCDTYVSIPSLPQRTVHVVHNSEHPASVFAILESGQKTVPLVADGLFDLLMLKIKNIYTKKQPKIESKGPRFELADFCIKLGSVTISQNFKGVLVEVEYRPCVVPAYCSGLMREFMQGFLGSCVQTIPPYLQNRMEEIYQPINTVEQYLEHFANYRKPAGYAM